MSTIKWGILGAGAIAGKFAHDLHRTEDCELIGIGSNSRERADAWAAEHGAQRGYGSYEQLLEEAEPDVVYVATRHPQHLAATLLCLERGIPVLCEKPLAVNGTEVRRMIEAAERNGTFLMEALWTRFLPSFVKARELVEAGVLGEVQTVKADFGFRREFDPTSRLFDAKKAGGALLDIGIYPLLFAQFLLGPPATITARATLASTGVDVDTGILLEYDSGQMAHLHATLRAHTTCDGFVYGSKANLHLHPRWHETKSFTLSYHDDRPDEHFDFSEDFGECYGYTFEIRHVVKCLRDGLKESPVVPLDFSRRLMATMDEIRHQIGVRYSLIE